MQALVMYLIVPLDNVGPLLSYEFGLYGSETKMSKYKAKCNML